MQSIVEKGKETLFKGTCFRRRHGCVKLAVPWNVDDTH